MNTEKQVRLSNCLGVLLVPFVVLALASQSAMALPLTFVWDAGQNWPSGTTIELEANGATANAIAATQYTINVPVQPGEVINARVRAIPPTGYECGDPLALCPRRTGLRWHKHCQQFRPAYGAGLSRVENM